MEGTYLDAGDDASRASILPEMRRCWGGGMSEATYQDYLDEIDGHPWARRRTRTLVLRDPRDEAVSSLTLHAVPALLGGKKIQLGGIARVITPESLRGRGYAKELMRGTIELLRGEGVDGAYLYSDIESAYYEQFGFRIVNRSKIAVALENLPDTGEEASVRPVIPDDWLTIWEIYADAAKDEPFSFIRDPEHWDYLVSRSLTFGRHDPTLTVASLDQVIVEDGEVVAYAIARADAEEVALLEVGMSSRDNARFDRLLGALRVEGVRRGCRRFSAPWPPGRWRELFESRFEPIARKEGIFMVAPLSDSCDPAVFENCGGSWETDRI